MSNVRLVNGVFTTPLWREPEHLCWRCYAWDCFADECELLKYFKYYQGIATRACYPNMLRRGLFLLACEQAFGACSQAIFLLEGDWGEGKKESAMGTMGRGKKGREAVTLSLLPSSKSRSLFSNIHDLLECPVRASAHAKNPSLKRCTFCSGKISSQPREGFIGTHELWG